MKFYLAEVKKEQKVEEKERSLGLSPVYKRILIHEEKSISTVYQDKVFIFTKKDFRYSNTMSFYIIDSSDSDIFNISYDFLNNFPFDYDKETLKVKECKLEEIILWINRLLSNEEIEQIREMFDFNVRRFGDRKKFSDLDEKYINAILEEEANNKIKDLNFIDTLFPEIERIYKNKNDKGIYGHPVHYMIYSDDKEKKEDVAEVLLSSLLNQKRITENRIFKFNVNLKERRDFFNNRDNSIDFLSELYNISKNGAMVLSLSFKTDDISEYATTFLENIIKITDIVKKYRNDVLTIFLFSKEARKLKKLLCDNLDDISFVEIKEDLLKYDTAKKELKNLALSHKVSADKNLYKDLENDKSYYPDDLKRMFDLWYQKKLKNNVYNQYRDIKSVNEIELKKESKGEAYKNLMNMTGLEKAKEVINGAIDFYKARKLFESYGKKSDNTSMHMIFTGSPGTAKTTTARLFAQIMKDNGLLSVGDLIEVGKADLCGKYVGWTAQMVKEKFRKAKGSVLFIDEAYSLCNEKAGGFGQEAIDTIVQEMENAREDTVVIFAGYNNEMQKFLNSNPGLKSRIAFHIDFEDYTPSQLYEILELMSIKEGFSLDTGVKEKVINIFEQAVKNEGFGNGRYARNLLERARLRQSSRLLHNTNTDKLTKREIFTLIAEDFEEVLLKEENETIYNSIGFSA